MPSLRTRRFALVAAATVVPASILLASCTGDDPRIVDGSDGGSPEAADPSVDAASTEAATVEGGADAAFVSRGSGFIALSQSVSGGGFTTSAVATFVYALPPGGAGTRCTTTTSGTCTAFDCDLTVDAGSPATNDAGALTAGVIKLTGGLIPAAGITLSPDAYPPVVGTTQLFDPGAPITVDATGESGRVPAFKRTVSAPPEIVVTSHTISFTSAAITVQRTTPLTVQWTADNPQGNVDLSLVTANAQRSVSILCAAPTSAGALTVPVAVLAKLFPAAAGTTSFISLTPSALARFVVDEYDVQFRVAASVVSGPIDVQ